MEYSDIITFWKKKNIKDSGDLESRDEKQELEPLESFLREQTVKTRSHRAGKSR